MLTHSNIVDTSTIVIFNDYVPTVYNSRHNLCIALIRDDLQQIYSIQGTIDDFYNSLLKDEFSAF